MTFYFKPPRGDIPLHKLQECLEERVRYLQFVRESVDIAECNEPFKFEYLTDGSALDRTGHFMLRLFALRLNALKEFLVDSECILFEKRLKCLKHSQVGRELRTASRHVKEILSASQPLPKCEQFLVNFAKLCDEMISSRAIHHTFVGDHPLHCNKHFLKVPFTFCLPLVGDRDVELCAGQASVPCGKWAKLLSYLFVEHIKHGMHQLAASNSNQAVWLDDRVRYLFAVLKAHFKHHHAGVTSNTFSILAKDVDERSCFFPPCMKNLHSTLRQRHRLSHYSRFYYGLFLKDIGMPLLESIDFWSQEYAQTKASCPGTSCSHSWQADSKRYIYSIRHMYGLEGSRREYSSPSCQQLQKMSLIPSSEGGCPFVHFDKEKLLKSLHNQVKLDEDFLKSVNNDEGAIEACKLYCNTLLNLMNEQNNNSKQKESKDETYETLSGDKSINVTSPAQFYSNVYSYFQIT